MSTKKPKQLPLLPKQNLSYGGDLQKTRKGRSGPRPLSTQHTIHLTLRSSKAKGSWSFLKYRKEVSLILTKFAVKNHVKILSIANVGNHLHLQIKLSQQRFYKPFIRAVTSAIAMKITKRSRWSQGNKIKFWDRRPFTRIVVSYKAVLALKDYLRLNQFEGMGYPRATAKILLKEELWFKIPNSA